MGRFSAFLCFVFVLELMTSVSRTGIGTSTDTDLQGSRTQDVTSSIPGSTIAASHPSATPPTVSSPASSPSKVATPPESASSPTTQTPTSSPSAEVPTTASPPSASSGPVSTFSLEKMAIYGVALLGGVTFFL